MKKVLFIIAYPFKKRKNTFSNLFSEAVTEGIRDTIKEMGYPFEPKKTFSPDASKNDKSRI